MCRSCPRISLSIAAWLLILLGIGAGAWVRAASAHGAGDRALAQIEADRDDGALDPRTASLLWLQRIFEPESLPAKYRDLAELPLRCATPLLHEFTRQGDDLDRVVKWNLDRWLAVERSLARAAVYTSSAGHFRLTYTLEGTHAVPAEDVDPANGIPDFVERCAQYLEESWTLQFDELAFVAPDLTDGPYEVSFQNMGTYGYTTTQGANGAGTRIVLNNDFLGFPPNDDPEGIAIGAAKVTCVHELRHASQFATSGWSESGLWVEVDATWIEDIGYDYVNDYYNYLPSGSSISNPTLPLDAGGSGSYEDCIWQHFMTERWDIGVVQSFWERRGTGTTEDVMLSYDWAMGQFGGSVLENFVEFAAWNASTGARAWPQVGYEEASSYPTAPLSNGATELPASFTHPIQRYAARFYNFTGFTQDESGVANVTVSRAIDSPLRAVGIVITRAGTRVVEPLALSGTQTVTTLVTPLADIAELTLVVAHGGIGIGTQTVTVTVEEDLRPPLPRAEVDAAVMSSDVLAGTIASKPLGLFNVGEAGSWLQYKAFASTPLPAGTADSTAMPLARSIEGSFFSVNLAEYTPGTSTSRNFTVGNGSRDFEWLAGVELIVPAGVSVLASTDFIGGTDGPLVSNGATGEATTLTWSDLNGSWGNVRNGQLATATVWMSFDVQLVGDLIFLYRIIGDGYGADPHEISGALVLAGPETPLFEILGPAPGQPLLVGSSIDVEWIAGFDSDIQIELSRDDGVSWDTLASSTPNDGHFEWIVSGPVTDRARWRLSAVGGSNSVTSELRTYVLESVPWVVITPDEAAIPSNLGATLEIVFDATSLAPGLHEAEVLFFHNGPNSPLRVPVQLDVLVNPDPAEGTRERFALQSASPNPFNPSTNVRFELFDPARVSIDVFDARGRFVRRLIDRDLPTGAHAVSWDSRDDQGAQVSSGVYFYVAAIGGQQVSGKIVLSK